MNESVSPALFAELKSAWRCAAKPQTAPMLLTTNSPRAVVAAAVSKSENRARREGMKSKEIPT